MNYYELILPVSVMSGLGLVFAVILSVSSRVFHVETSQLFSDIRDALPGANCGACGFAGCDEYARALCSADAPHPKPNLCTVGGEEVTRKLCDITGQAYEAPVNTGRAVVCCSGGKNAARKYEYMGLSDCLAASKVSGGPVYCEYGCIGLGTCVKACPMDAISIADGVARVDPAKCVCCAVCVDTCPKHIIRLIPRSANVLITCMSKSRGSDTRRNCTAGCIGCGICVKACPSGAITVTDNLAEIDYEKCISCGECAGKCPRKLIVIHEKIPVVIS